MLVFLLLVFKGPISEGQTTLFSNLIIKYIEEGSITVKSHVPPPLQFADLTTLAMVDSWDQGQGGENIINSAPINETALMAHNPTNTDYIEENSVNRSQIIEYTVRSGDLLSFISSDFGVSMSSIIWANNLINADNISPGQILKIPPVSGVIHIVKSGDTLSSIAKKYGANSDEIIAFNTLPKNGDIQVGYELIIPDGVIKSSTYTVTTSSYNRTFGYLPDLGSYFIQPAIGYNWGRIHGRNGIDVANSCGTVIYAAAEGNVATADGVGYNGGFGKYIKLIHPNGTETLYAHASQLLVSAGEYVQKGQKIALMGSTGRSTGCHLHFEVHGARNPLAKY